MDYREKMVEAKCVCSLTGDMVNEIERLRKDSLILSGALEEIRGGDYGYDTAEVTALHKIIDAALKTR